MTRPSGMDSDVGDVVAEESSHPFQVSFHPCFHAVPCHRTWLGELPLLTAVQEGKARGSKVSTKKKREQAYRRGSIEKESHGGSNGPLPWPCGAASVVALLTLRSFVPSSFLSLGVSPFLFAFSFLWPPHCERFSLLPLPHRDGRRQGDAAHDLFPSFTSSLCYVESFRAVQLANSVHRSLSACNRSNLLILPSGPRLADESRGSPHILL